MEFTSLSVPKVYSCQGNKRWSAHAFVYHPVITAQEALSQLVCAIPLPTDASPATSHPFPPVLCGTHQLWRLRASAVIEVNSSLISKVNARQRKGSNLGFLHGGCSMPDCEYKDISKNILVVPEISLILKESLIIKTLVPCTNKHLSSFTPRICSPQAVFKV